MRVIVSFFLSLIVYIGILIFLFFSLFKVNNKSTSKEILVHTAIVFQKPSNKSTINLHKNNLSKQEKAINKKNYSKTNFSKGGSVKFNDIFKNVNSNVPTTPVKLKKDDYISRFKGEFNKLTLKKIDTNNISFISSNKNEKKVKEFIKKINIIWNEISDNIGDFALVRLNVINGKIDVIILDSNLDIQKQNLLVQRISSLAFNGNLSLTIKFITKVKK